MGRDAGAFVALFWLLIIRGDAGSFVSLLSCCGDAGSFVRLWGR